MSSSRCHACFVIVDVVLVALAIWVRRPEQTPPEETSAEAIRSPLHVEALGKRLFELSPTDTYTASR